MVERSAVRRREINRLDNVKRQLYPGEDQEGQDNDQLSKNDYETPVQKSSRLTGNTLGKYTPYLNNLSTTPKSDLITEGDGIIVISWHGNKNLFDDRDAFITEFGTATPNIYSTEPDPNLICLWKVMAVFLLSGT